MLPSSFKIYFIFILPVAVLCGVCIKSYRTPRPYRYTSYIFRSFGIIEHIFFSYAEADSEVWAVESVSFLLPAKMTHNFHEQIRIDTVDFQWLEHLWNYENMFETEVVRANECQS